MAAISTAIAGIGLALTAVGVGTQIYGSSKAAEAQQQITGLEREQEAQRMKAMELDARRRQLEMIRQQQRTRSLSLTAANRQGASEGSGLQGGYGQISGATGTNLLGVAQNLDIGRNIFGLNSQISEQRIAMSQYGSIAATGSGLSSLGGATLNSLSQIRSLSGGFGSGVNSSSTSYQSPYSDPSRRGSLY